MSNENGNSNSTLLIAAAAMVCCCVSSSGLGLAWYNNWLCKYNDALCYNSSTTAPPSGTDAPVDNSTSSPSGGGNSGGKKNGGKKNNNKSAKNNNKSGTAAASSSSSSFCPGGLALRVDAMPEWNFFNYPGAWKQVKVYNGSSSKSIPVTQPFIKDCRRAYTCRYNDTFWTVRDSNSFSVTSGNKTSRGKYLLPGDISANKSVLKHFPVGSKVKMGTNASPGLQNQGPYRVADECPDCGNCEISMYTGIGNRSRAAYPTSQSLQIGAKYGVHRV